MLQQEESLDPEDWEAMRATAYRMVDEAVSRLSNVRDSPVWQNMPDSVRETYKEALPRSGMPLDEVFDEIRANLLPYPMGNIHPRFWMWYMGASNFTGALGDFLAAILGSNLGGGNHAAALMDQQVVDWLKTMVGFPAGASGTLTSGGSVANLIGLTVARNTALGQQTIREHGVAGAKLAFYASDQVHGCHLTAMEVLGLGSKSLRCLPSRSDYTMDVTALRAQIAEDRAHGIQPVAIIATAGTINTGAIDDLYALADVSQREGLWLHVDGCIGALAAIAPKNGDKLNGLDKADSVALDPHKWLHAPFEVGCCVVKDRSQHVDTFALSQSYLEKEPRGVAAADWLHDFGIQTSRGFRALKVWMSLKEHGVEKFGRLIDQNINQAEYLADRIRMAPDIELLANPMLDIVCFRIYLPNMTDSNLEALNREVMLRLQEDGVAALSDTRVGSTYALRCAISNHRTQRRDLDILVEQIEELIPTCRSTLPGYEPY